MAVKTVPSGCYEQPNDTESASQDSPNGFTADVKGPIGTLRTWANGFVLGTDTFNGHLILARSLRRAPGDLGVLTITMGTDESGSSESGSTAYKGVWSFHAARNDKSIFSFCSSSTSRVKIELWMKETDPSLATAFKFKKDDGTVVELNENEQLIAQKILDGRESVIRFYPVLTYTSYYKACPSNWAVDIGLIRTPQAAAADKVIAPSNINSVISGFVWLKVQDDVDEQPDSTFKRTQSWWGVSETDGGWDQDFYGASRWPTPLE